MAWRAMNSLLVLRDQANKLAPNRSKASDGLVGDEAHQSTNSDHNPHYVPGVGSEIVTALDLTHDPAHGFDSYRFAEVLRLHRDPRIKYVISNKRMFSSYAVSGYAAWTWRPYSGEDPHTNHVHVSVLDAVISDTKAEWNLEGFMATQFSSEDQTVLKAAPWQYDGRGIGENNGTTVKKSTLAYLDEILRNTRKVQIDSDDLGILLKTAVFPYDAPNQSLGTTWLATLETAVRVEQKVNDLESKIDAILALLRQGGSVPGSALTYHFEGTATPQETTS